MSASRMIQVSEHLCEAAERKFGHRFGTVEEIVATVLEQLLREDALQLDKQEEQVIEARLKSLGYI